MSIGHMQFFVKEKKINAPMQQSAGSEIVCSQKMFGEIQTTSVDQNFCSMEIVEGSVFK